jgi:signal transduction histidine kinase
VRRRIAAIAAVVSSIVLAVAAIAVVLLVQSQLVAGLDRSLEQRADQLAALTESESGPGHVASSSEDRFTQLLAADGAVLDATPNVEGVAALAELPEGRQAITTVSDVPIDDDAYRVLIRRLDSGGAIQYVVVGETSDDLDDGVRTLIATLAVVFPLAVVALVALVWWLVGRTLRPVEEIRRAVSEIGLAELDRRVPSPGTGDEIDLLAGTMNDMLARLESASSNQRRFVADVSHELRTPLTRMRTSLEVDVGRAEADLEQTARDVLGDTIDMQALVDDLLFLAHRDAGSAVIEHEPVDLDVIVDAEARRVRVDLRPEMRLDTTRVSAAEVVGDQRQLARLVRNLVSNALRHAEHRVAIELHEKSGVAVLLIDDDGPGIAGPDRDRVFERFVRLDEARSARDGGTGLGLAIVRDIATAHHGTVSIADASIGGTRVEVRLPTRETANRAR